MPSWSSIVVSSCTILVLAAFSSKFKKSILAVSGLIEGDFAFGFLLGGGLAAKLKGVALTFKTEGEAVGKLAVIERGREADAGRLGVVALAAGHGLPGAFAWLLATGGLGSAGLRGTKLSTIARVEVESGLDVEEESVLDRFDEGADEEELLEEPSGAAGINMLDLGWKLTKADGGQAGLSYFE